MSNPYLNKNSGIIHVTKEQPYFRGLYPSEVFTRPYRSLKEKTDRSDFRAQLLTLCSVRLLTTCATLLQLDSCSILNNLHYLIFLFSEFPLCLRITVSINFLAFRE